MNGGICVVTGGAGFIGSHLVEELLNRGLKVRIVDNCVNGSESNLSGVISNENLEFIKGDILDPQVRSRSMEGAQRVFHLACLGVRHSLLHPAENFKVNAEGTLEILRSARKAAVERFVNVASSEIYGTAVRVPMMEDHPTHPTTVYGSGKLAGEATARAFYSTYGMNCVMLRPFNTFGPRSHHEGDCGEVIPKFIIRSLAGEELLVYGDGSQTRDFTYVKDMARAIADSAERDSLIGGTWNIGSGSSIRIDELARKIARLTATKERVRNIQPRPGDVLALHADAGRFMSTSGWKPRVSWDEGLLNTIEYFRKHPKGVAGLMREEVPVCWEAGRDQE